MLRIGRECSRFFTPPPPFGPLVWDHLKMNLTASFFRTNLANALANVSRTVAQAMTASGRCEMTKLIGKIPTTAQKAFKATQQSVIAVDLAEEVLRASPKGSPWKFGGKMAGRVAFSLAAVSIPNPSHERARRLASGSG